jgi:integrase
MKSLRRCGMPLARWPLGDAIRLLILTGARREKIGQLKWSEIKGDVIALDGARTKNAEPHTIPLSNAAAMVLQRAPRIANSERVFTTTEKARCRGGRAPSRI